VVKSNEDISRAQGDRQPDADGLFFGSDRSSRIIDPPQENQPYIHAAPQSSKAAPQFSKKDAKKASPLPKPVPQRIVSHLRSVVFTAVGSVGQGTATLMQRKLTPVFYLRLLFWSSLLMVGGGAFLAHEGWKAMEKSLPNTSTVLTYQRDGTITIKADDGSILQQMGPATHEALQIWDYPDQLVHAFIASEDRRFYDHNGVDYQGVFRAIVTNIVARDVREGASTITQQLARTVFLTQERSIGDRKSVV